MFHARLHISFLGVAATLLCSLLIAEFSGYWLHRLLHSDKLLTLSRGHLIHHFLLYGPQQPMRAQNYKDATNHRLSLGNVGLEWLLPSGVILLFCWALMALLHVHSVYQILALCTLLGWPVFMFSYLHDRMHIENFWMTRTPFLKIWFLKARRLHDIHHRGVNSAGRMDTNFGIGFYFFDRMFRTASNHHRPFNWLGYQAAVERYGLDQTRLISGAPKTISISIQSPGPATILNSHVEPSAFAGATVDSETPSPIRFRTSFKFEEFALPCQAVLSNYLNRSLVNTTEVRGRDPSGALSPDESIYLALRENRCHIVPRNSSF